MSNLSQLIAEAESLTNQIELRRIKEDPYYFLTRYCYTLDEHNHENPYQLIPRKEYIKDLCDLFLTEDLLAIEKSRQMMVSWVMVCAIPVWFCMFHRPMGTRVFIVSKKEQDANAMLDRQKIIYERLPEWMKASNPADPFSYNRMAWGKNNTIIQGVPQGADQLRQYTATLIVSDETAFQDQAEKAYESARPSLLGGGKFVAISTPNGKNWFYRTCKDLW